MKILVKKQILYKSNLSRGILLIYSNWNDVSLDYNKPNKKMKDLLQCLKNMGITKYLESLLKTYKIEFNEQQTISCYTNYILSLIGLLLLIIVGLFLVIYFIFLICICNTGCVSNLDNFDTKRERQMSFSV
jgi:hypothetical protein